MKTGNLSIHTENIFPIIKKFLYSNQEVFLRELVSNAVDATQKLKTLASVGEFSGELGDLKVEVILDAEKKTLTIRDSGIGMTAEEVEKYINQIAFSGASEFLDKYKDQANGIIGHFGLGFYSSFMVAESVEIQTKSWKNEPAAHWTCEGQTTFSLQPSDKDTRGTDIILHIHEDSEEFLSSFRISEILRKYCAFLPVPVYFEDKPINETEPLWTKKPANLTEDDYIAFYRKLYPMSEAPMFWIHLNVDYPFNLTGILYFPKLKPNMDIQKNKVQLYSNQVFITDNVEDIVPDYLTLLHGIIDSPDIPLNVSRSYLQTDIHVKKIASHIIKKVADKLISLFQENREDFNKRWENIGVFMKYGMLRDNGFYDRVQDIFLLETINHEFFTLKEYSEKVKANQTDKNGDLILLYTNDKNTQDTYIQAATQKTYDVLVLDGILDMHLVTFLEQKLEKTHLIRVDSGTPDKLIDKGESFVSLLTSEEENRLKELFEKVHANTLTAFQVQPLGSDQPPLTIVRPEHQRRMQDMTMAQFAGIGEIPDLFTVMINSSHPVQRELIEQTETEEKAKNLLDLAFLSQGMLKGAELTRFIQRMSHLIY